MVKRKISEVIDTGLGITYLNYDKCKEILNVDGKVLVKKPYVIKKYKVRRNDNLTKIAKKFNTNVTQV